jgi:predicted RecA/RadA family phage recombinase
MATFRHDGDAVDYTPGAAVTAGDVVVQGTLIGVCTQSIAANKLGALAVKGVFDFAKATGTGTALTAGLAVYWDDTNDVVTATASGNVALGKVVTAAATTDAIVRVRLQQ